jgi:hypothetical protein
MFLKCVELGSQQLWFSFNIDANFTLDMCNQTILLNNYFNPWKTTSPRILKHMSFSYDFRGFFSRGSTNSTCSFPFFLLSGLLLEPRFIVLLEATCTLDATWGNKFEVAFGSPLKNNLKLKIL